MVTAKKTSPVKSAAATRKRAASAPSPTRPAVKKRPASKAPARPVSSKPSSKTVEAPKVKKVEKPKKPKLVRDSFTIPKLEYLVLEELKQRANRLTRPAKKSELLRAGIKLLASLPDAGFLAAMEQVPAIKTGRPAADKQA